MCRFILFNPKLTPMSISSIFKKRKMFSFSQFFRCFDEKRTTAVPPVVGPLGGKFDFFSPSGFEIQSDFDYRTSKIKFYSVRALKSYVNEKNLIHDRVTATISKFSPRFQMFKCCPYWTKASLTTMLGNWTAK